MTPFPPGSCFFENRLGEDPAARLYSNPCGVIEARELSAIVPALEALDRALTAGRHAAGYMAFEAGYAFEPRLANRRPAHDNRLPLLRFFLYKNFVAFGSKDAGHTISEAVQKGHRLHELTPGLGRTTYEAKAEQILELIRAGDIYQANFTFPLGGRIEGDPLSLYAALRVAQPVSYGAFLRMAEADVLSLSPELFVARESERLTTRPMKGTAARCTSPDQDTAAARALRADPKERAENLMIVDLLRNDLSRVCAPGSVKVPQLFTIETYPTLHTMTSTVEGRLSPTQTVAQILKALFPCGSVTGAPKIRAQEIIHDLEASPRGIYTGAIGYLTPDGDFQFNVAIRTLTAFADGTLTYPIGSGIVADSDPAREYDECLLKARVLMDEAAPFELIETLAWSRSNGFALLDRHLERIAASAAYFHRPCRRAALVAALEDAIRDADHERLRVRMTLDQDGRIKTSTTKLERSLPAPLPFVFSHARLDASNPLLRHKTTRRTLFESELARAKDIFGALEVVFENQHGELTEGAWTNLFVERDGRLLTPPLASGLLPGTLRADLLASGRAAEAVLTREDLGEADCIYLGNSVRGLMKAVLLTEAAVALEAAVS